MLDTGTHVTARGEPQILYTRDVQLLRVSAVITILITTHDSENING